MNLDRLSNGEKVSGVSAILLYVFMSFDWFGVEVFSKPNPLLIDLRGSRPGQSAWEALDYIPIILLITIFVTLTVAVLRLMNAVHRPRIPAQSPIFLALLAAAGIAFGGCLAMWEEGFSLGDLRARRG